MPIEFCVLSWSAGPLRRSNSSYELGLGQNSNLQSIITYMELKQEIIQPKTNRE